MGSLDILRTQAFFDIQISHHERGVKGGHFAECRICVGRNRTAEQADVEWARRYAAVEVCGRQIEIVVRNILERSVRRPDRRTQSRLADLAVRGAVDFEPVDDIAIRTARKYL